MTSKDPVLSVQRTLRARVRVAVVLMLLFAVAPMVRAADTAADALRISSSQAGPVAAAPGTTATMTDVFAPLVQFGYRGGTAAQTSARVQTLSVGAYSPYLIYSAFTDLLVDDNGDGYYQRFRITFDADVDFGSADVYARLYLSLNGGPWNLYYTTGNISISGTAKDDAYSVDTTLSNGYPYGSYDVLIELYDAYSDALLTEAGPYDFVALSALPLEDQDYDSPDYAGPPAGDTGGGGAFGGLESALLAMFLARRVRFSRRQA